MTQLTNEEIQEMSTTEIIENAIEQLDNLQEDCPEIALFLYDRLVKAIIRLV